MKSPEEEFCKSKFDEFLQKAAASTTIQWRPVAQKDEPPDYYLSLDGIEYAVEVTTLMEKLSVGSMKLPQVAIGQSLWGFIDEVKEIARQDGYLNGAYVVGFLDPIDNFREIKEQIQDALLDYIKNTQNVERAPEKVIFGEGGIQRCSIQKVHNSSNKVMKGGPTYMKWEGEAAVQICVLLEERLADKVNKLRNIAHPKILLLLDHYRFADPYMYYDCISKLTLLASYHTIFIVRDETNNFVLHSVNSNWH